MDKRLIFCVLLVTLSGSCNVATAETTAASLGNNSTTPPASNMTATVETTVASVGNNSTTPPASNMTAAAETTVASVGNNSTTPPASNMTTAAETTVASVGNNSTTPPASNMTTAAETTVASLGNNSTTPASNMSATVETTVASLGNNSTTPASNVTTAAEPTVASVGNNSTTPASNVTTAAETTVASVGNNSTTPANNMTTAAEPTVLMAMSTTFSAVSPNTTVLTLETNITNTECGAKQLCVAEPSRCDPSVAGSCFFLAAKQQSGRNFNFDLSGESDGYIAATLTGGVGEGDPTYVCANSKGTVKFFGSILINGVLNISTLDVNSVKGKVRGKTIQCSFLATVPQPMVRATNLGVLVSTGEYNDTKESLGAPTPVIRVGNVDLANPNNTVTNEIINTTTPAPSGNNATTVSPPGALIPQLSTNITRQECGSSKLCAAEPSECNPAAGDSCYFLSVKQQSGQIYKFELSGQSEGYVAAGLSTSLTQNGTHIAYICANNNGNVRFFTGIIENLELNLKQSQNSSNEQGKVDGSKIQCTFSADLPDTTQRAAVYALSVSTGSYDANTFQLGKPLFHLLTSRTNLADPTANLTNLLNGTTSYAPSLLTPTRSFLPALLVTVCMLAFTAM